MLIQRMNLFSQHFLKEQYASLAHLSRMIKMADPTLLLKRGFSITYINGKAITRAAQIQEGDQIETTFFEGKATSTVSSKN